MAIRSRLLAGPLIAQLSVVLAACRSAGGEMEVQWSGADTGRATLAATARRCEGGPLEIVGVSGDTGVAIGLFTTGGIAGHFDVHVADSGTRRRGATLGARWLDSAKVRAWQGVGGRVTVRETASGLSGEFDVQARASDEAQQAAVRGSFRDVVTSTCSTGPSADSGGA